MSLPKNKLFFLVCLIGLLAGYGAAEWIMPRYFHPTPETREIDPQSIIAAWGLQPKYYRPTTSGNYLASQYAQRQKDWEKASDFMGRVLQKEENNVELKRHAMVLAMGAGQVNRAIALAKDVSKVDDGNEGLLERLFLAVDDFQNENYLGVIDTLNEFDKDSIAAFIVPVLKLWANAAQGNLNTDNIKKHSFYAYHVMLAGQYLNKPLIAVEYADKAFDLEETDVRNLIRISDLFAQYGKADKALEILKTLEERGFKGDKFNEKIKLLQKGESIDHLMTAQPIKSPKQGAAWVFMNMAEILVREYSDDSAIIFARMGLFLDPNLDEGYMIVGNILGRHSRFEEAIYEYKKINEDSEFHIRGQRSIADLYTEQDEHQKAIDILNKLYDEHDDIDALIQIGDIYRYKEDYHNAIDAYDKVTKLWDAVPDKYWHVLYARGMAYERIKNYKKAEEDLQSALAYRPDHPYLLNYLGYSWTDQGINLSRALDMIEKAAQAKPDDGYIADSLGWVYYKMNDYEGAISHLETAVELLPYDATINDHLGDAYWHVGRKIEARFQWRRAINYSEENELELKEKIEQKLVNGIPKDQEEEPIKALTDAVKDVIEETTKPSL